MAVWRNWQTRQTQNLVSITDVSVRPRSPLSFISDPLSWIAFFLLRYVINLVFKIAHSLSDPYNAKYGGI